MKLSKVFVENFVETLTENELKNHVGGYDVTYDSTITYGSIRCCCGERIPENCCNFSSNSFTIATAKEKVEEELGSCNIDEWICAQNVYF